MKTEMTPTAEKHSTIKLVEGTYTPAEAADILFSLIGDKIKFHNLQILSLQERFGLNKSHSEERIRKLKEVKNDTKDFILEARDRGYQIQIDGAIQIKFVR